LATVGKRAGAPGGEGGSITVLDKGGRWLRVSSMRRVFALWVLWGAFVATSSGPLPGAEFLQYLTEKRHFLLSASRHF